MNADAADITVVLDRSVSMRPIRRGAIAGFNTFLEEQKRQPGSAALTLVQFAFDHEFVHRGRPLPEVPPLDERTYSLTYGTALLDAVGRSIEEADQRLAAMPPERRPGRVVFAVLTDGEENSSRSFTRPHVFEMIRDRREYEGWEFVFLAANQDAIRAGGALGIAPVSSMDFSHTPEGVRQAFSSLSRGTSRYRGGESPHIGLSDGDRSHRLGSSGAEA